MGRYWLVYTKPTEKYHRPIELNESAAEIIRLLLYGKSKAEVADTIADREGVESGLVSEDIDVLLKQILSTV